MLASLRKVAALPRPCYDDRDWEALEALLKNEDTREAAAKLLHCAVDDVRALPALDEHHHEGDDDHHAWIRSWEAGIKPHLIKTVFELKALYATFLIEV